jgi:hypothetical protein
VSQVSGARAIGRQCGAATCIVLHPAVCGSEWEWLVGLDGALLLGVSDEQTRADVVLGERWEVAVA